jgi:hypothetical protein
VQESHVGCIKDNEKHLYEKCDYKDDLTNCLMKSGKWVFEVLKWTTHYQPSKKN